MLDLFSSATFLWLGSISSKIGCSICVSSRSIAMRSVKVRHWDVGGPCGVTHEASRLDTNCEEELRVDSSVPCSVSLLSRLIHSSFTLGCRSCVKLQHMSPGYVAVLIRSSDV